MQKLPVVSGHRVLRMLNEVGYQVLRQRGSHVRLVRTAPSGEHHLTIPMHDEIAKGTLNDILTKVAMVTNISKESLIERLS